MAADLTHDNDNHTAQGGGPGKPFFGTINTFISYTWRGDGISVVNLVAAIKETLIDLKGCGNLDSAFFFLDISTCAQHRGVRPESGTCPNATDVQKFEEVIQGCTRLLLYCTPIAKPKALSPIWCLFELMSAMKLQVPVSVALGATDRTTLAELLATDFDGLVTLFSSIESAKAQATVEADRAMVTGWIVDALGPHGFTTMDLLVGDGLRGWVAGARLRETCGRAQCAR